MITEEDFNKNLKVLRILHAIKMFPMQITVPDDNSNCSSIEPRGKNRKVFGLVFALACIHSMYLQVRLAQYIVEKGLTMSYELALHVDVAIPAIYVTWWYWISLYHNPNTAIEMLNMLHRNSAKPEQTKSWRWKNYTRQDWLAALVAPLAANAWVGVFGLYCMDPSMKFLVMSLPQHTSPWLRAIVWPTCILEEAYVLLFYIQFGVFTIHTHVLYFEVAMRSLSAVAKNRAQWSSYSRKNFLESYRKIRELQLWTVLFNELNSAGLYLFKLYCIIVGTMMGFSAVRNEMGGIFSVVFAVIFADIVILYSVLYEKAFAVPETCGRAKRAMIREITGSGLLERQWKNYGVRCIKSVPNYGIRVGSFHTFERESTPAFIDYVVRNIAGLLVM